MVFRHDFACSAFDIQIGNFCEAYGSGRSQTALQIAYTVKVFPLWLNCDAGLSCGTAISELFIFHFRVAGFARIRFEWQVAEVWRLQLRLQS